MVDSIRLSYDSPLSDTIIFGLKQVPNISTENKDNTLNLMFQSDFLTYVQWPYFSAVEQTQKITGRAKTLEVYAHQLFEDTIHNFALKFNEKI